MLMMHKNTCIIPEKALLSRREERPMPLKISEHAASRMNERALSQDCIEAALAYGREVHTRGITIFAIGRKEVESAAARAINIARHEGLHVLCGRDGAVVTAYRNLNLRGLRPRFRTRSDRYNRSRVLAIQEAY
jgi:hypothetical protein